MDIFTLTLNPAFDLHCEADDFVPYGETVIRPLRRDAGGKGINVSRTLSVFGVKSTAYVLVGRDNRREYENALYGEEFYLSAYPVDGRIRENVTLHTAGKPETRLRFPGFSVSDAVVGQIFAQIAGSGPHRGDCFVFSGSVPPGVSRTAVTERLCALRERGLRMVLDSVFLDARDIAAVSPFLIKPNEEEACRLFGIRPGDDRELLRAAMRFCREGHVGRILLSRGERGAWLLSSLWAVEATAPHVTVLSAVGAGDSSLAGYLFAMARGKDEKECLRHAVAAGTAACMTEGTLPPAAEDMKRCLAGVTVRDLC